MTILLFSMQGKIFFSILLGSVMSLHLSMQEEDILEHIHGKCHVCAL